MNETDAAKEFVAQVRINLTEFAERTDRLMILRGFEREELVDMPHIWLETAADVTNEDIAARDEAQLVSQVNYIAAALERGDEMLCKALDCTYVETLLWNVKDPSVRAWAWGLFPGIVRHYFERMWGAAV
jgi:hypothetical protein